MGVFLLQYCPLSSSPNRPRRDASPLQAGAPLPLSKQAADTRAPLHYQASYLAALTAAQGPVRPPTTTPHRTLLCGLARLPTPLCSPVQAADPPPGVPLCTTTLCPSFQAVDPPPGVPLCRQLTHLHELSVEGNPFCKGMPVAVCRAAVLSHAPASLRILDASEVGQRALDPS